MHSFQGISFKVSCKPLIFYLSFQDVGMFFDYIYATFALSQHCQENLHKTRLEL